MAVYICEQERHRKTLISNICCIECKVRRTSLASSIISTFRSIPIYGFAEYAQSISRQIKAVLSNKDVSYNSALTLNFQELPQIPLSLPPVFAVTTTAISEDTVQELQASRKTVRPGHFGIALQAPSYDNFVAASALTNLIRDYKPSSGFSGIASTHAFIMLRGLVASFLSTYVGPVPTIFDSEGYPMLPDMTYANMASGTYTSGNDESFQTFQDSLKRKLGPSYATEFLEKRFKVNDSTTATQNPLKYTFTYQKGLSSYFNSDVRVYPPSALPAEDGIGFPWFNRMADASIDVIIRVLYSTGFVSCMGNAEAAAATIEKLRQQDSFIRTAEGNALCHIFRGIEMALSSQTGIYLVFQGSEYLGFSLTGNGFRCVDNGRLVDPMPASTLTTLFCSLSGHSIALEKIATLLNRVRTAIALSGNDMDLGDDIQPKDIDTAEKLLNAVNTYREHFDETAKNNLAKISADLNFRGQEYMKVTADNIVRLISAIDTGVPLSGYNIDLKGDSILEETFVGQQLLRFGPLVPSLMLPGKKHMRFARDEKSDPVLKLKEVTVTKKGVETKLQKRGLEALYVTRVPLKTGKADWLTIHEMGSIAQDGKKLTNKESSSYVCLEDDKMLKVWRALRCFYVTRESKLGDPDAARFLHGETSGSSVAVDLSKALF